MNIDILKPLTDETNKTWNLSSDEKLLNALKLFSNEITKSTQACTEYMHDLNYSLNETETSLRNTFNEFIMLGNSQFIENVRIYFYVCMFFFLSRISVYMYALRRDNCTDSNMILIFIDLLFVQ